MNALRTLSCCGGIDPVDVVRWQRRIGATTAESQEHPHVFRGRSGLLSYSQIIGRIAARDPDAFETIQYERALSLITAVCGLHTPRRVEVAKGFSDVALRESVAIWSPVLDGTVRIYQDGREFLYTQGDLIVIDCAVPFTATYDAVCDVAALIVPRKLLGLGAAGMASSLADSPQPVVLRSLAQYVRAIACGTAAAHKEIGADVELVVVRVIRDILGRQLGDVGRTQRGKTYIRTAVGDLIERRYRDAEFSADDIAEALHMSRRHLYRHFASEDVTIATMLTRRRLEEAARLLDMSSELGLDAVAQASGFSTAATLRNRMRSEWDITPTQFRQGARPPGVPAEERLRPSRPARLFDVGTVDAGP